MICDVFLTDRRLIRLSEEEGVAERSRVAFIRQGHATGRSGDVSRVYLVIFRVLSSPHVTGCQGVDSVRVRRTVGRVPSRTFEVCEFCESTSLIFFLFSGSVQELFNFWEIQANLLT